MVKEEDAGVIDTLRPRRQYNKSRYAGGRRMQAVNGQPSFSIHEGMKIGHRVKSESLHSNYHA